MRRRGVREEMRAGQCGNADVVPLVVREGAGEANAKEISGERGRSVRRIAFAGVKGKDAKGAANLGTAKRGGLGFSERAKPAGAVLDGFRRHLAGKRSGGRAGSF